MGFYGLFDQIIASRTSLKGIVRLDDQTQILKMKRIIN